MIDFEQGVWFYCSALAAAVPVMIPALQFGLIYKIWDKYNKKVDRNTCQNTCWDTVFKAGYETGAGSYKHVYFNATSNTLVMWSITVVALVALYEAVRMTFVALYMGRARPRMCVLFLSVLYPHYYAWWAYMNYYNDDFYDQCLHQLFFTLTELVSTVTVLELINKENYVTPRKVVIIMSVAALHILASGWDQFVANVLRQEGQLHQVMRDLGFMLPDILHLLIPWFELKDMAKRRGVPPSHLISNREFIVAVGSVFALWIVCVLIKS